VHAVVYLAFSVTFKVDDNPLYIYNSCGTPCQRDIPVLHSRFATGPAYTFVDLSSTTVQGRLQFIGTNCAATDLDVEAKDNANNTIAVGRIGEDGTWAVSVPQNVFFTVYFRRTTAPDCESLWCDCLANCCSPIDRY
jgi:hypothetical protein